MDNNNNLILEIINIAKRNDWILGSKTNAPFLHLADTEKLIGSSIIKAREGCIYIEDVLKMIEKTDVKNLNSEQNIGWHNALAQLWEELSKLQEVKQNG